MSTENKPYVGDIGTVINIDCGENIAGGTSYKFLVRKPQGDTTEWTATLDGTQNLKYTVQSGDFNQAGKYLVQPQITLSTGTWKGTTTNFVVYGQYH